MKAEQISVTADAKLIAAEKKKLVAAKSAGEAKVAGDKKMLDKVSQQVASGQGEIKQIESKILKLQKEESDSGAKVAKLQTEQGKPKTSPKIAALETKLKASAKEGKAIADQKHKLDESLKVLLKLKAMTDKNLAKDKSALKKSGQESTLATQGGSLKSQELMDKKKLNVAKSANTKAKTQLEQIQKAMQAEQKDIGDQSLKQSAAKTDEASLKTDKKTQDATESKAQGKIVTEKSKIGNDLAKASGINSAKGDTDYQKKAIKAKIEIDKSKVIADQAQNDEEKKRASDASATAKTSKEQKVDQKKLKGVYHHLGKMIGKEKKFLGNQESKLTTAKANEVKLKAVYTHDLEMINELQKVVTSDLSKVNSYHKEEIQDLYAAVANYFSSKNLKIQNEQLQNSKSTIKENFLTEDYKLSMVTIKQLEKKIKLSKAQNLKFVGLEKKSQDDAKKWADDSEKEIVSQAKFEKNLYKGNPMAQKSNFDKLAKERDQMKQSLVAKNAKSRYKAHMHEMNSDKAALMSQVAAAHKAMATKTELKAKIAHIVAQQNRDQQQIIAAKQKIEQDETKIAALKKDIVTSRNEDSMQKHQKDAAEDLVKLRAASAKIKTSKAALRKAMLDQSQDLHNQKTAEDAKTAAQNAKTKAQAMIKKLNPIL